MIEDKAFSSIDFVGQCLIDKKRSLAFSKAIQKVVKKGAYVLDLGTGSGIMALFAARSGAKKVTGLEFDSFIAAVARKNISANNFDDTISVIEADARNHDFEKGSAFNVIVMEMLTTGMVDEFQVQAINNLHRQSLITEKTILVPYKQDTFLTLGYLNYKRYGFSLPTIRHLWKFHHAPDVAFTVFSKKEKLHSIDFRNPVNEHVQETVAFKVTKSGTVNTLELSSVTFLGGTMKLGDTESINAPVALPIDTIKVKKGDILKFTISYRFGHGYNSFKIHRIL